MTEVDSGPLLGSLRPGCPRTETASVLWFTCKLTVPPVRTWAPPGRAFSVCSLMCPRCPGSYLAQRIHHNHNEMVAFSTFHLVYETGQWLIISISSPFFIGNLKKCNSIIVSLPYSINPFFPSKELISNIIHQYSLKILKSKTLHVLYASC